MSCYSRSLSNDPSELPGHTKVLVVRCCRTPVFAKAVKSLREMHSNAEIWGLAQPDYHAELRRCGVDRLLSYPGRRYSRAQIPLSLLREIRREHFDIVAVPHMNTADTEYLNVHFMVAGFGASKYVVLPANGMIRSYKAGEFQSFVVRTSAMNCLTRFDVPLMLCSLLLALLRWRRNRYADRRHSKQRILHIITSLGAGGAQVQLAALMDQTPRDRFDIEVLVLNSSDGDFSKFRFKRSDVPISYLPIGSSYFRSIYAIARLCRINRYDVVHTWLFLSNILGTAGARLAGCPRIISSVRNLSLWKRTWYHRPWLRLADFLAARLADVVTVNGSSLVDDYARWALYPQKRIAVVPNGLDPEDLSPSEEERKWVRNELGLSPETPVVGTVGRLAPEKDQALFLRIIHRIYQDLPSVHAVIVGDGDLRFSLQGIAEDLGLAERIHFVGERMESRKFIGGFDLFILTSRIEGFPNALLEAVFLAIPSLSTDVGAARDIFNGQDCVFPVGDTEAGYCKAKACLMNPQAALSRARRLRDWATQNFSSQRMASDWLSLYEGTPASRGCNCETRSDPVALLP